MQEDAKKLPQNEKVILPDNVVDLIDEIVADIGKVKDVVDDLHSGSYSKAVSDVLGVVGDIIQNIVLPKVLKESESDEKKQ